MTVNTKRRLNFKPYSFFKPCPAAHNTHDVRLFLITLTVDMQTFFYHTDPIR